MVVAGVYIDNKLRNFWLISLTQDMKNARAVTETFVTEKVVLNNFTDNRVLYVARKLQVWGPQLY